jgi:AraC-like DNA-binding protein
MNVSIKKWFSKYKKYFFSYKDGFFELPFLANSPELIVESFKSMPFVKTDDEIGMFSTNNLFIKGKGYYQKLENGLWVILSEFEIKRDLCFKSVYEEGSIQKNHILMLFVNKSKQNIKKPKFLDPNFEDGGWMLLKSGGKFTNTHFKGQHSIYLTIYFDNEWMHKHMQKDGVFFESKFEEFFNSKNEYISIPNLLDGKQDVFRLIVDTFQKRTEISSVNTMLIKGKIFELFSIFFDSIDHKSIYSNSLNLTEKDQRKVIQVKNYLDHILTEKFPSIQFLADKVKISESKLKSDFKSLNKMTIYEYFTMKKMHYAKYLIQNKDISIKEISLKLAYENQSKFSLAYKRVFNHLPSETSNIPNNLEKNS